MEKESLVPNVYLYHFSGCSVFVLATSIPESLELAKARYASLYGSPCQSVEPKLVMSISAEELLELRLKFIPKVGDTICIKDNEGTPLDYFLEGEVISLSYIDTGLPTCELKVYIHGETETYLLTLNYDSNPGFYKDTIAAHTALFHNKLKINTSYDNRFVCLGREQLHEALDKYLDHLSEDW
jgi:hypothetical protein